MLARENAGVGLSLRASVRDRKVTEYAEYYDAEIFALRDAGYFTRVALLAMRLVISRLHEFARYNRLISVEPIVSYGNIVKDAQVTAAQPFTHPTAERLDDAVAFAVVELVNRPS